MDYDGHELIHWNKHKTYTAGEFAYYNNNVYRCNQTCLDDEFDPTHWDNYGSIHGLWFKFAKTFDDLPTTFSKDQRKLYFVLDEQSFYLWNGDEWDLQMYKSLTETMIRDICATGWRYLHRR